MKTGHVGKLAIAAARRWLNQIRLRNKKIFAVGFNKSGTSSLHALFQSLGLPSYHGEKWRGCDDLRLLRTYDCFSDGIPQDLPKLDRLFPSSKFILQVRDLDEWIYSRLAHIERAKDCTTYGTGPEWDATEDAIKAWIRARNSHHLFLLAYFSARPSDLLVVNFIRDVSAATKVCNFLGYSGKFERLKKNVNPSPARPRRHTEMVHSVSAEFGIAQCELKYDILCPSLIRSETYATFPADTSMLEPTRK